LFSFFLPKQKNFSGFSKIFAKLVKFLIFKILNFLRVIFDHRFFLSFGGYFGSISEAITTAPKISKTTTIIQKVNLPDLKVPKFLIHIISRSSI